MTVWQTVRRTTNEILGLKGLSEGRNAGENVELPLCDCEQAVTISVAGHALLFPREDVSLVRKITCWTLLQTFHRLALFKASHVPRKETLVPNR